MPSSARQRIPAELWRHNYRSPRSSPTLLYSQDIQACPGHWDMHDTDMVKANGGKRNPLTKSAKKNIPGNRKNFHSFSRRGSSESLNEISNSARVSPVMSSSLASDSGLYHKSGLELSDSFALDPADAPHPSQLPSPPVEWLKPQATVFMESTVEPFHSLMSCFAAAQKCC